MSSTNPRWFQDRFREKRLSQRRFASLLGVDPATLSLLLRGKRRMRVEQAAEIARLLGVPVADVMRNAGVDMRGQRSDTGDAPGSTLLPLVGWIGETGNVSLDWSTTEPRFEFPADLPPTAVCVQIRTANTAGAFWDGWLLATLPPREPDPADMLDRYCIVGVRGRDPALRTVRRGYTPGRYTLIGPNIPAEHDAELTWYAPILLIKPV